MTTSRTKCDNGGAATGLELRRLGMTRECTEAMTAAGKIDEITAQLSAAVALSALAIAAELIKCKSAAIAASFSQSFPENPQSA